MNRLIADVVRIDQVESLHMVSFACEGVPLTMMSLEIPSCVRVGTRVVLGCKSSSVTIGKELQGLISFSNQMRCCVESIEQGALVSVVRLRSGRWMMESLITTVTLERMALGVGDEVTALIKASALSIVECLDV